MAARKKTPRSGDAKPSVQEQAFFNSFVELSDQLPKIRKPDPLPVQHPLCRKERKTPSLKDENSLFLEAVQQTASQAASPRPETQEAGLDFIQAMQGVRPIEGKGRALPAGNGARPAPPKIQPEENLEELLQGRFEFSLEYSEDFLEGHILGLDPQVVHKLRAGQYSPEAHIDLHGLNLEQASSALPAFIRDAYQHGRRSLLVVTGRGKNSPDGQGVLRAHLRDWLTKEPLKRVVHAFCTAQPKDGGAGAVYLLLRKYQKRHGKIRWDRSPLEEDPLTAR